MIKLLADDLRRLSRRTRGFGGPQLGVKLTNSTDDLDSQSTQSLKTDSEEDLQICPELSIGSLILKLCCIRLIGHKEEFEFDRLATGTVDLTATKPQLLTIDSVNQLAKTFPLMPEKEMLLYLPDTKSMSHTFDHRICVQKEKINKEVQETKRDEKSSEDFVQFKIN